MGVLMSKRYTLKSVSQFPFIVQQYNDLLNMTILAMKNQVHHIWNSNTSIGEL